MATEAGKELSPRDDVTAQTLAVNSFRLSVDGSDANRKRDVFQW